MWAIVLMAHFLFLIFWWEIFQPLPDSHSLKTNHFFCSLGGGSNCWQVLRHILDPRLLPEIQEEEGPRGAVPQRWGWFAASAGRPEDPARGWPWAEEGHLRGPERHSHGRTGHALRHWGHQVGCQGARGCSSPSKYRHIRHIKIFQLQYPYKKRFISNYWLLEHGTRYFVLK